MAAGPARRRTGPATRGAALLTDPQHHHRGRGDQAGHAAARWDERYAATERLWSAEPNATVASLVGGGVQPGRALDVGAGEGRHSVWLRSEERRVGEAGR